MNAKDVLNDHPVFQYFYRMNQIPRASKHEAAISRELVSIGTEMGYLTEQDEAMIVRIRRPADPEFEQAPRVLIQGHMDMVCVKAKDSLHNFDTDPIEMVEQDGWLQAKATTLGGDDGIGVAMGLALISEKMALPAIDILITTDEEEGMSGAIALKEDWLDGEMLINIDSEEEGYVTGGCAGGSTGEFHLPVNREAFSGGQVLHLCVSGMRGGHSGMNILTEPNNAIKIMSEWIRRASQVHALHLHDFSGGSKHNAIPNEAEAWVSSSTQETEALEFALKSSWETIQNRVLKQEPDIHFSVERGETDAQPLSGESCSRFLSLIDVMPHGVFRMRPDHSGVEASDNLAIVRLEENEASLLLSTRSGKESTLEQLQSSIQKTVETFNGQGHFFDGYPAWEFRKESRLRDLFGEVYREETGTEVQILDIHAGLECAMFAQKKPSLDMISIGPELEGAHTIGERLNIASTVRTYEMLKKLVLRVATEVEKRV